MDIVHNEETELINYALTELKKIPEIHIYGETDTTVCPRAGSISFNITGIDHGLTAAILNDYFNIAVRNECFCAHPYVEKMLHSTHEEEISELECQDNNLLWKVEPWMGMVRVSFGIYNTISDVDHFIHALKDIILKHEEYSSHYVINDHGDYEHKTFEFSCNEYFSLTKTVQDELID